MSTQDDTHTSRYSSESARDAARERLARRRAWEHAAEAVDEEAEDLGGRAGSRPNKYSRSAAAKNDDGEQALFEANRPRPSSRYRASQAGASPKTQKSTSNSGKAPSSSSAVASARSAASAAVAVLGSLLRGILAILSAVVSFVASLPRTVLFGAAAVLVALLLIVSVFRSCAPAPVEHATVVEQPAEAGQSDDAGQSDGASQEGDSSEEAPAEQADFSNIPSFVSAETVQALQGKVDDPRIVSIVNNASALGVTGETYQRKMLELAAKDPQAIDYVADFPSKYPASAGQPYEESVSKGTIPDLKQWDERWGYVQYCGAAMGSTGCCPTSLSMVYMGLTGKTDKTPADMAALSAAGGYAVDGEGTVASFLSDTAPSLGLSCVQFWPSSDSLIWYLQNGYAVIVNVGEGDFTESGHFFVAHGVASDGTIEINDPYSSVNTAKTWDADVIVNQSMAMYAFKAL